jgi:hypothetical protein
VKSVAKVPVHVYSVEIRSQMRHFTVKYQKEIFYSKKRVPTSFLYGKQFFTIFLFFRPQKGYFPIGSALPSLSAIMAQA